MKRLILLIATIVSVAIAVHAVNYDLWINGIQVTSSNASNLGSIDGVSGTVTYNANTKTLTLNNATISAATVSNIKNGINGLTIQVVGTNTLKVTANNPSMPSLHVQNTTTITGTGTLNCYGPDYYNGFEAAACNVGATLTIQGGVQANFSGRYGFKRSEGAPLLVVNGANTRVTANGSGVSIYDVNDIELNDDLAITSPAGVYIDAGGSAVYSDGSYVREQVVISNRNPGAPIYYNLWINKVQINSENASNITVIADTGSENGYGCTIRGTVTYNANTKTLTLNNAYLGPSDYNGPIRNIKSRIDGLTINVEGRDTLSGSRYSLDLGKSVTIKGSGVLDCQSNLIGCELQDNATLTVRDGVQSKFYGINYGVHGVSPTARMIVSGSSTKVTASGSVSCIYQTPTTLNNGLALTLPQGAHFDSNGTVMDANNDTITGYVHISLPGTQYVEHDLWVNGTQVTSANASDLSVIDGVTGNVSFDEYTNTLTLDNATITGAYKNNIINKNNSLTINALGVNTLVGRRNISSYVSLKITGTGTLDCTADDVSFLFGYSYPLVLPPTITIQGGVNAIFKGVVGISGTSRINDRIVLNNHDTHVTVNGSSACVRNVSETQFNDGLRITQPVGAYFDQGYVRDADGNIVYNQDVVICNPDCGPYAVYNAATTTLTFAYGNKPDGAYDLNTGTIQPDWFNDGTYANVTKVVFDPSFAEVRPTTTYYWFRNMSKLTNITGLNYLNTSEVTFMDNMFQGCSALTSLDLSSFNTANVTRMIYMFYGCSNLESLDISGFNTGNVTTMLCMFANCKKLASLDLSNFNTANVTDMYAMFLNCNKLATLDLMSFNTSKVTDTELMFGGCSSLTTIYVDDSWTTAAVTASNNMFQACTKLVGGAGTTYNANYLDKTYARLDGGPNSATPGYLSTKPQGYAVYDASTTTLTFRYGSKPEGAYSLNTGTNLPAWYRDGTCTNVTKVVFDPSFAEARPKTTYCWFSEMTQLTNISGFNYLNTSEVTSMRGMFYVCASITTLDLSSFNTAKVTDMLSMFENCHSLVTIKVSNNWSTSAVTSSNYMFRGCNSIKGQAGTTYDANHVDKAYAHVDGGTSNPGYLTHISRIYHEGLWYVVENSSSHGLRLLAPQFGSTYSGDVVIPESFKIGSTTWNVTCIDEEAFTGTAVTSVFVPGNVDHIYSRAFYGATQLSKLVIGYMYSPSYLYFGDDWVGNNASNLTCYVRNRFINSYENLFSGMNFSPWVLISESYYTDLHPYRAFSCKYKVTLPEGLEAYYVKDFNSATRTAVTQKVTGVLPTNTGFLLKGSESKIYLLEKSTATPATVTGNLLVAYVPGDQPWTIQDDNARFYFDDFNNEWISTTNLFNYSSYLQVPKSQLGDDLTTPIHLDLENTPEPLVGDANEDGAVNVNDITTIINYILGKNPNPFNFDNANVNGDDKVDVLDITALINIILGIH